jgi:hypothetical protein
MGGCINGAGVTYWPWNEAGMMQGAFANVSYLTQEGLMYVQSGSRCQWIVPMAVCEMNEDEEEKV